MNLRSDVAIVYGIDLGLPARMASWRDRGYRIHVMTGVSWGNYQDYLYGRFDGINHEDEAQTDREGRKISHGGDVYYMCPGENYGRFLSVGVQRALDAGAEAIHLEEPEFWVRGGYSEGFKRAWKKAYGEDWQPPHSSVDAQWRASKLKYALYRHALQQIFDHVQAFNRAQNRQVRCYVPTHSLLNYAHWRIVSPESSLAQLNGCDGYIAQVWTGTARTPNVYRGIRKERTFETAYLEYGAMQNLVRATGRRVWYLNDPVEDNPSHDWADYRGNWESTLVASLLQPEVWRYEVMPWPNRVFQGRYPSPTNATERVPIPGDYATELLTVVNALNHLNQDRVTGDGAPPVIGVVVSDTLMFQRGEPHASDAQLSHFYGLALPLVKRGVVVDPVQLENVTIPGYLRSQRLLVMTYHGQKPLRPEVHAALADWVRPGGSLVFWDDDQDPYHAVREWWNSEPFHYSTAREHLWEALGLGRSAVPGLNRVGRGRVLWRRGDPADLARRPTGDAELVAALQATWPADLPPFEPRNYFLLQRGHYRIAAGLDESPASDLRVVRGRFINLFDPTLGFRDEVVLSPGSRWFLLDLDAVTDASPQVLAAACKFRVTERAADRLTIQTEGVHGTQARLLMTSRRPPRAITLDGQPLTTHEYDAAHGLLWISFANEARLRRLEVQFGS